MNSEPSASVLPRNLDRYLAALSKLYELDGNRELQEILVNAKVRVQAEWSFDNWNGGTRGHAVFLSLPEHIFLRCARKKDEIQASIREGLNSVHNVQNEYVHEVFLEMDVGEDHDWRLDSGLLITSSRIVSPDAENRIWDDDSFRLFLSHKTEYKVETAAIKKALKVFGVSSFVAHEDIHPSEEWQEEIENALSSMDGFVALMSKDFHDSKWTDQEVGFAVARGVPRIAVMLGGMPYGFMGKFQGLRSTWESAAKDIAGVLIKNDRMFSTYLKQLRSCPNFDQGNVLGGLLPSIVTLNSTQVDELVSAFNENYELRGAFAFNGNKPAVFGEGLLAHLKRLDRRKFKRNAEGLIERFE